MLSYHLKENHGIFLAIPVDLWELYHQVHKVGASFLFLIDHFYLPEGQPVQPVHFWKMAIPMSLTQLTKEYTYIYVIVNIIDMGFTENLPLQKS